MNMHAHTRRVPGDPGQVEAATVTVVIPCYNYARYLPQAVESILSQTGVAVDVVVVDDASGDDSLAVARRLASADRRVRVVAHAINVGPVQTFNDGLALAHGEFLVRLDADDLLTPGSLARSVAVMRNCPSVGLVYGHPLHFSGETPPRPRLKASRWTVWPGRQWLRDRCVGGYNVITSPEVLMRKSVVDKVGGQSPLDHTHDMEMWLRMAAFCDVAYVHGADQAWHRDHAASLSAKHVDALRDLLGRRDAFDTLFEGPAGCIPEAERLKALARRALAVDAIQLACMQYDGAHADLAKVEWLRAFANSLVPDAQALHCWAGLEKRMAMGAKRASRYPPFFVERVSRGLMRRYRRRLWHRTGV